MTTFSKSAVAAETPWWQRAPARTPPPRPPPPPRRASNVRLGGHSRDPGAGWSAAAAWVGVALAAAVVGGAGALVLNWRHRRARAKANARQLAPQTTREDWVQDEDLQEAAGEADLADAVARYGLLHGVRVVDFGGLIAGPSVCRIMAELGAEVIKVEPLEGDTLRKTFLAYEQPRGHGTAFETQNLGKASVALDVKTPAGRAQLKELLRDADVLVTNFRAAKIRALGLDYDSLAPSLPHLVYANLTAWGEAGPDEDKPGLDVAAFWAATGLSALVHGQASKVYSMYPAGSGDVTTAQVALAGVMLALAERAKTGLGRQVSTSLMHCGSWCTAPYLVQAQRQHMQSRDGGALAPLYTSQQPPEDPLHTIYRTSEGRHVAVAGHQQGLAMSSRAVSQEGGLRALVAALELDCELAPQPVLKAARAALGKTSFAAATKALRAQGIVHRSCESLLALCGTLESDGGYNRASAAGVSPEDQAAFLECLEPVPSEVEDMEYVVGLPYSFTCSQQRGSRCRAPAKGEHTEDVLASGWLPRPARVRLPAADRLAAQAKPTGPLAGCVIVELVDLGLPNLDVSVSAATSILAAQGAAVVRVEPKGGDPLRREQPELYELYNAGKEIFQIGDLSVQGNGQVQALLQERAHALVTNMPLAKLSHYNLDSASLAARCPELLIVQVRSHRARRSDAASAAQGCLGAMYAATGLFTSISGWPARAVPAPPRHVLELMSSLYVVAAFSLGWFHKRRAGKGQVVGVFHDAIGLWSMPMLFGWLHRDPGKARALVLPAQDLHLAHPMPPFNAFATRDGMWVQLLGNNLLQQLTRLFRALGISMSGWARLALAVVRDVLPNKEEPNVIVRARPAFVAINTALRDAMARIDYADFARRAARLDVWFVPVRMPSQLLQYEQAHCCGLFETMAHGHTVRVTSPLALRQAEEAPANI